MTKKCKVCGKKFITKGARKYCSKKCSASVVYYVKKNKSTNDTLCWDCKNACGNCAWSKNFTPVEGWVITKTKIKGNFETDSVIDSCIVHSCPEFIRG